MGEQTGFDSIPDHYVGEGREVIDIIRDELGDQEFVSHCLATARTYDLRAGKKTPGDEQKAAWYRQMASHVAFGTPDPRSGRPNFSPYKRARTPEVRPFPTHEVLDHGYVRLVEDWGHGEARVPEAGIVEAARQSTQGGFRGWASDARLLRYLHEHKHSTPFEFAGMVIEVQAPIFVFREWHRHRTQSYSEMSARYAPVPDEHYLPTIERLMMVAEGTQNKQAGPLVGSKPLTLGRAALFQLELHESYAATNRAYMQALEDGVPKELARLNMPVGRYSRMRASANLRNWLQFLTLRLDPAAQWEIRQYAQAVLGIVRERFPQVAALFAEPQEQERKRRNGHGC